MNLIDRDERQLKDAIAYIDGLKAEHSSEDAVRGSVHVHRLEDADKPLSTSWMVLEVQRSLLWPRESRSNKSISVSQRTSSSSEI